MYSGSESIPCFMRRNYGKRTLCISCVQSSGFITVFKQNYLVSVLTHEIIMVYYRRIPLYFLCTRLNF